MMFADTIKQWDINLLLALNGSECAYLDGIMWILGFSPRLPVSVIGTGTY